MTGSVFGEQVIQGTLDNLGHEVARGTIADILKEHGMEPAPERNRKTTWQEFYPAVSARDGLRSVLLMRKPGKSDYAIRLSFDTEEQRVQWAKSDAHQKTFPALTRLCKPKWDRFAVIHPK
jgi:putative transposase